MNITPIDTLATEAAKDLPWGTLHETRKKVIEAAIRQALREREKFMGHEEDCQESFRAGGARCDCGFSEVQKEMKG